MSEQAAYITTDEIAAIAATVFPRLTAIESASPDDLVAAAIAASDEIDAAGPYQGCKLNRTQTREFPRVPYPCQTADVWDWDNATQSAVVPPNVKKACLIQVNYLLQSATAGDRRRQEKIRAGLTAEATGDLSESYSLSGSGEPAARRLLCNEAAAKLSRYLLETGELL